MNGGSARGRRPGALLEAFSRTHLSWVEIQALGPDLATGFRAALATVIPLCLSIQLARPELRWMAFGGWLATLADPGGSRARRARILFAFVPLAASLVWAGQIVAVHKPLAVVSLAAVACGASFLRAWGSGLGGMGTMLAIVTAIATAVPSRDSLRNALWFAAGSGITVLLSSTLWPVWTHLPVRRSLAVVYSELSRYCAELARSLKAGRTEEEHWVTLARHHPRRIREAIEAARAMALAVRARHSGESGMGSNLRVLLGLAETQFLLLVTLASEVEGGSAVPPEVRATLDRLARRYARVRSVLLARAWRPSETRVDGGPLSEGGALRPLLARLDQASTESAALVGSLGQERAGGAGEPAPPGSDRFPRLQPLWDSFSDRSPIFRHAIRVLCATALSGAVGTWLSPEHAAWVSITTVAVLQPYSGATVKMATERVVGTCLGCLLVILLAATTRSPLLLALSMFPLSMAAVVTRPRSFRLFTFFVTPVFVLVAMHSPGDWSTAAARAGDTVLGGGIALLAALFIYPGWEERIGLPAALSAMSRAVEAYQDLVQSALALRRPEDVRRIEDARRRAGMAINEAETTLERRLAQPMNRGPDEARAMERVTFARRLALAVTALDTWTTHAMPGVSPPPQALERVQVLSELLRRATMAEAGTAPA